MTLEELYGLAEMVRNTPDPRPERLRRLQDEPSPNVLYYRFIYEIANRMRPAAMLETGTRLGHSAAQMASGCPEGKVVTLDIDPAAKERVLSLGFQNIVPVTRDTTLPGLASEVKSHFGSIDLLFLDSDHSYRVVSAEYKELEPLVREGGVIIFDDINLNSEMKCFWSEIKGPKTSVWYLHTTCSAGFGVQVKGRL